MFFIFKLHRLQEVVLCLKSAESFKIKDSLSQVLDSGLQQAAVDHRGPLKAPRGLRFCWF